MNIKNLILYCLLLIACCSLLISCGGNAVKQAEQAVPVTVTKASLTKTIFYNPLSCQRSGAERGGTSQEQVSGYITACILQKGKQLLRQEAL